MSESDTAFFGQFEGRIQAVSGQFGCPDFLYHEGRKKEVRSVITNGREYIDRLRACGMSESSATDICYKYAAQDDEKGLVELVRANELLYDDRREYV